MRKLLTTTKWLLGVAYLFSRTFLSKSGVQSPATVPANTSAKTLIEVKIKACPSDIGALKTGAAF
jgi:hypothetical protein